MDIEKKIESVIELMDEKALDLPLEERVVLWLTFIKQINTRIAEIAESSELTGAEKEVLEMHNRKARAQIEELQRLWGEEISGPLDS